MSQESVYATVAIYENRILEFVKFICHALSLDTDIKEEIRIMKKNCLKLLHICKIISIVWVSLLSSLTQSVYVDVNSLR